MFKHDFFERFFYFKISARPGQLLVYVSPREARRKLNKSSRLVVASEIDLGHPCLADIYACKIRTYKFLV